MNSVARRVHAEERSGCIDQKACPHLIGQQSDCDAHRRSRSRRPTARNTTSACIAQSCATRCASHNIASGSIALLLHMESTNTQNNNMFLLWNMNGTQQYKYVNKQCKPPHCNRTFRRKFVFGSPAFYRVQDGHLPCATSNDRIESRQVPFVPCVRIHPFFSNVTSVEYSLE